MSTSGKGSFRDWIEEYYDVKPLKFGDPESAWDGHRKLVEKMLDEIKERLPKEKDTAFEASLKVIGLSPQYIKGYNQALSDTREALFGSDDK